LVPVDQPLTHNSDGELVVPKGTRIETITDKDLYIKVEGDIDNVNLNNMTGYREYLIPAGSEVRSDPVDRYALGIVIAIAVVFICLWGTLIGAMLPIFFKRLGWDPAVASGPFVATFVDISGIAIFCSLAKWILLS
jgi:magnesium transporter